MKVGVVLFGNGHVQRDGSVKTAINVQPLTANLTAVQQRISSMKWQRGLTNMAQALVAAEKMLLQGARGHAQSAILVLSDGRYLFKYKTSEKAKDLRDKNIQIFMAPISEYRSKELDVLHGWVSQPWEANYERIPGIALLKNNEKMFAQKLLAKFCPLAVSLARQDAIEDSSMHMLIHAGGTASPACGPALNLGTVESVDKCAESARASGRLGFAYAESGVERGHCLAEGFNTTKAMWDTWKANRESQTNPCGSWKPNPHYDTYALKPHLLPGQ